MGVACFLERGEIPAGKSIRFCLVLQQRAEQATEVSCSIRSSAFECYKGKAVCRMARRLVGSNTHGTSENAVRSYATVRMKSSLQWQISSFGEVLEEGVARTVRFYASIVRDSGRWSLSIKE